MRGFRDQDLQETNQIRKCCHFVQLSLSNSSPQKVERNLVAQTCSKPKVRKSMIKLTLSGNTIPNNSLSVSFPLQGNSLTNSVSNSIKKMKQIKSQCKTDFDSNVKPHQDRSDMCSITSSEGPQVFEGGKNLWFLYSSVSQQF